MRTRAHGTRGECRRAAHALAHRHLGIVVTPLPNELTSWVAVDDDALPEADNTPSGAVLRALALAGTSLGPDYYESGFAFPSLDEGTAQMLAGMVAESSEQAGISAVPASAASGAANGAEWASLSQKPEVLEAPMEKAGGDALGLELQASVLLAAGRKLAEHGSPDWGHSCLRQGAAARKPVANQSYCRARGTSKISLLASSAFVLCVDASFIAFVPSCTLSHFFCFCISSGLT